MIFGLGEIGKISCHIVVKMVSIRWNLIGSTDRLEMMFTVKTVDDFGYIKHVTNRVNSCEQVKDAYKDQIINPIFINFVNKLIGLHPLQRHSFVKDNFGLILTNTKIEERLGINTGTVCGII